MIIICGARFREINDGPVPLARPHYRRRRSDLEPGKLTAPGPVYDSYKSSDKQTRDADRKRSLCSRSRAVMLR